MSHLSPELDPESQSKLCEVYVGTPYCDMLTITKGRKK